MIIVFDAQCLLCSGWVRFLLRHDRSETMRFASIQTKRGQQLLADVGLQVDRLDTLLVLDDEGTWQHTKAILRVVRALGWPWKLATIAYVIPTPIRDFLYRGIARNRYWLFGRSETCLLPPAGTTGRFIVD